MKVAILSDIHSNLDALEAVLADIKSQGIEKIWNLGDILGYNAYPKKCLNIARESFEVNIMGNHDGCSVDAGARYRFPMNNIADEGVRYSMASLKEEDNNYIKSLPYQKILPELGIALNHGTFFQPEYWHYVQSRHDAISEYLTLDKFFPIWQLSFVGHTHVPSIFTIKAKKDIVSHIKFEDNIYSFDLKPKQKYIINVGSVGQPRDENPKSCYCILDMNDEKISISLRRVEYDIEKAYQAIIDVGLSEIIGRRLRLGR